MPYETDWKGWTLRPSRGVLKVTDKAVQEALRLNHSYIGTEHMFLGALGVPWAAEPLRESGLELANAQRTIEFTVGKRYRTVNLNDISGFSTRAEILLGHCMAGAIRRSADAFDTADMIQGIYRLGDDIVTVAIGTLGVPVERLGDRQVQDRIRELEFHTDPRDFILDNDLDSLVRDFKSLISFIQGQFPPYTPRHITQ